MSYAQYLRQLLRPLGVYDVESRYLGGELESEGLALDGVESVLDELQREANLATAQDWGLEACPVDEPALFSGIALVQNENGCDTAAGQAFWDYFRSAAPEC